MSVVIFLSVITGIVWVFYARTADERKEFIRICLDWVFENEFAACITIAAAATFQLFREVRALVYERWGWNSEARSESEPNDALRRLNVGTGQYDVEDDSDDDAE